MIDLYLGYNNGVFNKASWDYMFTFNTLQDFNKHMKRVYKMNFKDIINNNDSIPLKKLRINMELSNSWLKVK